METKRATSSRTAWVVGAIAVVMGVLLGAVAVMVLRPDASGAQPVTLVRSDDAGADPFTESVQTDEVPAIAPPAAETASRVRAGLAPDDATAVLVATGTQPGLYGGSGDVRVCDPSKLVAFLDDHPDKAAAWSSVLGIAPDGIDGYVASLTPVVLLSDTLVTNHGFSDGRATASTSVLQAGTAVMVDREGVPRVKCNCGNPLTPPEVVAAADWDVEGDTWSGFDTAAVTGVVAGDPVDELVVADVATGATYPVPVGGAPSTGSTPPTTPAPTAASDLRGVDWANRTYSLDQYCLGPEVTLSGGVLEDPAEYQGVRLVGVEYGDLTGDGADEALVKFSCYSIGGNAYPATPSLVFTSTATGPLQLGQQFDGTDATIVGDTVQDTEAVWGPNDPRCCPSTILTHTWRYRGGAWVE